MQIFWLNNSEVGIFYLDDFVCSDAYGSPDSGQLIVVDDAVHRRRGDGPSKSSNHY